MALNKWMHPRNPYKTPPNFKDMAIQYSEFRKVVTQDITGKIHLDFNDPIALRTLTTTLFLKDFQLKVSIPETSLIPTLPSRLNYLLWVEDLTSALTDKNNPTLGLDVGTGASAVYPLLAVKHLGWRMFATESDDVNYKAAMKNIESNDMEQKINLVQVNKGELLSFIRDDSLTFDFMMCNPPFFSLDKVIESPPGSAPEMMTEGGEVEFVSKLIAESKEKSVKVRICTVLLGHKSSLNRVKKVLSDYQVLSHTSTQFCQGKTMRWGIAWTFFPGVKLDSIVGTKAKKDKEKPFSFFVDNLESLPSGDRNALKIYRQIRKFLEDIGVDLISKKENKYLCSGRIIAKEKSWQKQRKKRREMLRQSAGDKNSSNGHSKPHSNQQPYGKFSEVESRNAENNNIVEDELMNELLSSEFTSQAVKNDDIQHSCNSALSETNPVLECDLFIRWSGPSVKVDLCYIGGEGGRESVHQLTQFVKNKLYGNR